MGNYQKASIKLTNTEINNFKSAARNLNNITNK